MTSPSNVHRPKDFAAGAVFRTCGTKLDFARITQELGIAPTHAHKLGEFNQLNEAYETDMWSVSSPLNPSEKLELHIDWLRQLLLPRKQFILSLKNEFNVDIYCFKTCYTEQASLTLSSRALELFVELGIELGVSLIFLPDEVNQSAGDPE